MKRYILLIFIFSQLYGCVETKEYKYVNIDEFPNTVKLQGKKVKSINPLEISDMAIMDTLLVIISKTDNSYIQVYSTISNTLLGEFSSRGRGPGEFLTPLIVKQCFGKNNNILNIYDDTQKTITKINLNKSIENSNYIYESINLDEINLNENYIDRIFYIDEDIICYETPGHRFSFYSIENEIKTHVPYCYPEPDFPVREQHEYYMYFSQVCVNPNYRRVVAAPHLIGQIDFFDFHGDHITSTGFDIYESFKNEMHTIYRSGLDNPKRFIGDIVADNNYIYALNYNIRDNLFGDINSPNNEILVFDWEGMPVKKILLDKFAGLIAIDNKHKKIYAYAPFEMDYTIVKYDLDI